MTWERMVFERELKGRDLPEVLMVGYVIYLPR
jgi:hypothetical protein